MSNENNIAGSSNPTTGCFGNANNNNIAGSYNPSSFRKAHPSFFNKYYPDPNQPKSKRGGNKPSKEITINETHYLSALASSTVKEVEVKTKTSIYDRLNHWRYPNFFWGWALGDIPTKFKFPVMERNCKNGPPPI